VLLNGEQHKLVDAWLRKYGSPCPCGHDEFRAERSVLSLVTMASTDDLQKPIDSVNVIAITCQVCHRVTLVQAQALRPT